VRKRTLSRPLSGRRAAWTRCPFLADTV